MQDYCQVIRYIRMSSNPTGGNLIKFFPHSLLGCIRAFYYFWRILCLFVCFNFLCVFCCCIVLYFVVFFNITMKFQDASCP